MSSVPYDILIVEDDRPIREVLRLGLESEGYAVREATDGVQALSILREMPSPGLIILDFLMPGMGGRELLDRLQTAAHSSLQNIPVVVMSAVGKRIDCKYPQVRELLQKPVDWSELFFMVNRHLVRSTPA